MTGSLSNFRACGVASFRLVLLTLSLRLGVHASSESELMPLGSVGRCLLQSSGDMQLPSRHNFMAGQQYGLAELEEPGPEELQERGQTQRNTVRADVPVSVPRLLEEPVLQIDERVQVLPTMRPHVPSIATRSGMEKKVPPALGKALVGTAATTAGKIPPQPYPSKSSAVDVVARSSSENEEKLKSLQAPAEKMLAARTSNSSAVTRSLAAAASGNARKAGNAKNHVMQPLTYYNFMAGEQHSSVTHHKSKRSDTSIPQRLAEPSLQIGESVQILPEVHPQRQQALQMIATAQHKSATVATGGLNPMVSQTHSTPSFAQFLKTVGIAARSVLGDERRQRKEHMMLQTSQDAASSSAQRQVVVGPRSRLIMKKLAGGHSSDSRMRKLDRAFVLKLLQGGTQSTFKDRRAPRLGPPKPKNQSLVSPRVTRQSHLSVECNVPMRVAAWMDKDLRCPKSCPLMAKENDDGIFCDFKCVSNSINDCRTANPRATVPDLKRGICRACYVQGCERCKHDGTDTCSECANGYQWSRGKCNYQFAWVKYAFFGFLGLSVLVIIAWIVTLYSRPIMNMATLVHALGVRSRTKLHQPLHLREDENGVEGTRTANGRPRKLWPLTTNLCTTDVAGPGLALHFNFQVALIIWAVVLALAWAALGFSVEYPALFSLGTDRATTPWANCWIVQWAYHTQQRLMWTKVGYLIFVYLFTFVGAIFFGIYQLRRFELMGQNYTTHKDFCVQISGLPRLVGSVVPPIEEEIKKIIATASSQRVVGVSVCWDMADKEDLLMQLVESELEKRDTELHGQSVARADAFRPGMLTRMFSNIESIFLSPTVQKVMTKSSLHRSLPSRHSKKATLPDPKDEETGHVMVVDPILELHKLQTTSQAFVVFETEVARDAAVHAMSDGVEVSNWGCTLTVEAASCEPDSLMWGNMHNESLNDKAKDIAWGICVILFVLLAWTLVVYLPFVWVSLSGNYAHGREPDFVASFTFGMIVVAGNALMYMVCGEVADRINFQYIDSRELCYMGLYLSACVLNVALDMICAYYVAYYAMLGVDMKTYWGIPLQEVESFTERFETFAMQRELGHTLLTYTMPFTTLVPFLVEPLITIYLPWKIMVAIVRTKPEIQGVTAETYLRPLVMDMSRYADLLLNVMLAVLIFFFPGGFNLTMFVGLALSHIYLYVFDHYRVLRATTACDFAGKNIDWWAQWAICIPCGIVLACYVYKSNCEGFMNDASEPSAHGDHKQEDAGDRMRLCEEGSGLVLRCLFAFICHVIVHTVLLIFLVPCFGRKQGPPRDEQYEHCARRLPMSWFSANPVHCLRSQYIYNHSPPCDYSMLGKQHLVRVNPRIGCYFSEKSMADTDDYTEPSLEDLRQLASRKAIDAVPSLASRLHRQLPVVREEQHELNIKDK